MHLWLGLVTFWSSPIGLAWVLISSCTVSLVAGRWSLGVFVAKYTGMTKRPTEEGRNGLVWWGIEGREVGSRGGMVVIT